MQFRDISDEYALPQEPSSTRVLLDNVSITYEEFVVKKLELRQYTLVSALMPITVYLETDRDKLEMEYEMEATTQEELENTSEFLKNHVGLGALIARCIVQLRINLGLQKR